MHLCLKLVKNNWLIVLTIIIALLLRTFQIAEYMTFLGDEGRDASVWLRMTRLEKFTLIGPQTSIGNMYLGPLFYYLMWPSFILIGTAGPSVGTALFAGGTTFLLWYCGKSWFSSKVGLIAAVLYAVSPTAIVLSRSAWNPNIMPFFALLTVWGIWQFWQKGKYYWLLLIGFTFSVVVQSHYLGLLLGPLIGIFVTVHYINILIYYTKKEKYRFTVFLLLFVLIFVALSVLPLVWFDLRHNGINFQAMKLFFTDRQTTVNLKIYKAIPNLWALWQNSVTSLLGVKNTTIGLILSVIILIGQIGPIGKITARKAKIKNSSYILVGSWLILGLIGLGLYKQHIYDHYFGFIFPAIFLLAGLAVEQLLTFKLPGKYLGGLALIGLVIYNLYQTPLKYPPGRQMIHTKAVADKIILESEDKPFNLGMIAKQNYDAGYRYFLELAYRPAVAIDAQRYQETVTGQLFVVCEVDECKPIGHPQAEIANFGWAKIDQEWHFDWGTKLYKLVHNQ